MEGGATIVCDFGEADTDSRAVGESRELFGECGNVVQKPVCGRFISGAGKKRGGGESR
jgi:hypothetical protein